MGMCEFELCNLVLASLTSVPYKPVQTDRSGTIFGRFGHIEAGYIIRGTSPSSRGPSSIESRVAYGTQPVGSTREERYQCGWTLFTTSCHSPSHVSRDVSSRGQNVSCHLAS